MKSFFLTMFLCIFFSFVCRLAAAQEVKAALDKQKFHFGKAGEDGAGYAQGVRTGKTIYISGTVGGGDAAVAIKNVYDGLRRSLAFYGATFQNVVKENLYTTDIEKIKANNEIRKKYYEGDFPAATWVQISRLYEPTALLEVELVAVLP